MEDRSAPIRVLVVEDNHGDVDLIREALSKGPIGRFRVDDVDRLREAVLRLAPGECAVDVVLLDLGLPDSSGLPTLVELRRRAPDVPIVVLTNREDEALALDALKEGAQDYLEKGIAYGGQVSRSLLYAVERRRAETNRLRLVEERAARVAAEQALHARDEFVSIAAHELRTPVSALALQLQTLQKFVREHADERLSGKVDRAVRNANRLSVMIDSLLDVSRIATGSLELNLESLDLSELVTDVCERISEGVPGGCQVKVDVRPGVTGDWDRLRIEQCVLNLLSNAVKYGGGKPIEVGLEADAATARLSVRDRGIGIAPEDLARVFDRFERAAAARRYCGLGLGLYVTRRIVEAHGGQIRVTSALAEGSTFTIEIPRRAVARVASQQPGANPRAAKS